MSKWLKGNQDALKKVDDLVELKQLNINMDHHAKG